MDNRAPIIKPGTYQDILDAPEHMVAELAHGVLHLQRRPPALAALAQTRLMFVIFSHFCGRKAEFGGWWILREPEVHLGENVLVPNAAGWKRERMPELPDASYTDLAPDWACEVLSPDARQFDLVEKRALYGEAGVGDLWFVDPKARTLEAFANTDGVWTLVTALKDDDMVSVRPFDAIEFDLSALWPD